MMRKVRPLAVRFREKVGFPNSNGCKIWLAGKAHFGYGKIKSGGTFSPNLLAHRVAWMLANGPIPKGLCVLHKCDVPACVNPEHLFLGTKADNNEDKMCKGRHRVKRTLTLSLAA